MVFRNKQPNFERIKEEIKSYGFLWTRNRANYYFSSLTWDDWCNFELGSMGV
ncbi:hypothetical protein Hanom_Chr13g01198411 [Helianthus anomalus]